MASTLSFRRRGENVLTFRHSGDHLESRIAPRGGNNHRANCEEVYGGSQSCPGPVEILRRDFAS